MSKTVWGLSISIGVVSLAIVVLMFTIYQDVDSPPSVNSVDHLVIPGGKPTFFPPTGVNAIPNTGSNIQGGSGSGNSRLPNNLDLRRSRSSEDDDLTLNTVIVGSWGNREIDSNNFDSSKAPGLPSYGLNREYLVALAVVLAILLFFLSQAKKKGGKKVSQNKKRAKKKSKK